MYIKNQDSVTQNPIPEIIKASVIISKFSVSILTTELFKNVKITKPNAKILTQIIKNIKIFRSNHIN